MRTEARQKRSKGFTILETLLAVTLFTIVMSSSYSIFSMGLQIWRRTQGADVVERKAMVALERMGRDMRLMVKTMEESSAGEGLATQVTFPAIVTEYDAQGNPFASQGKMTYMLDKQTRSLCVQSHSASAIYTKKKPSCKPLAEHVKQLRFKYWLYEGIGDSFSWYDRWDGEENIPQAIEVTLELDSKLKGEKSARKREYKRTFLIPVGGKPPDPESEEL